MNDPKRLMQQTRAYEYVDGLQEITLGLIALLVGTAITFMPPEAGAIGGVVGAVILAGLIQLCTWGITEIRMRFTWPRTGYVKPNLEHSRRFRRARLAGIFAVEAILIAIMFLTMGYSDRLVALAIGILLFYAGEWAHCKLIRWLVVGLLAPVVVLVVTVLGIGPHAGFFVLVLYMGLGTLVNGIYALSNYMRTPPSEIAA